MALGAFRLRGCTCKKKRCTCGAKWYFRFDIGPDPVTNERRQRERGGFSTKSEAQEAAKQIYAEIKQGTFFDEKDVPFEEYADSWMESYIKSGNVKPSTIRTRTFALKKLKAFIAKIKMREITPGMYQGIIKAIKSNGSSDSSIIGIHALAKMIFKKAKATGVIINDPTQSVDLLKTKKTVEDLEQGNELPKYLEKMELKTFLDTAATYGLNRDIAWFTVLAYTGMRVGELCALKWRDIDFEEHRINITKTVFHGTGKVVDYEILTPKTNNSHRLIEVEELVIDELKKHRVYQNLIRDKHGDKYHDKDFVFANTGKRFPGYPEMISTVENRMERILHLAELNESLTPHSLRHTHTSLLAEAEVSIDQIMDRLGHQDDETTRRVYLHVTKPRRKEASQKFAELMRGL